LAENEEEEVLLIDDEEDEEEHKELLDDSEILSPPPKKTNTTLVIVIILLLILILLGAAAFFVLKDDQEVIEPEANATTIIKNIKKSEIKPLDNSKLARLTAKAQKLYQSGKKDEALKIYKKISFFHKSLAEFNLGVTLLKDKKYKEAIDHFQKAFELDDLKFESSLNIAICYRFLEDKENFKKYINQADEYIISKYNSKLFNYYMGLIKYYKNLPFESLVILRKYDSSYFEQEKDLILSKEYTYIKNYDLAVQSLSKTKDSNYYVTMGELYAKKGEYELAAKYFRNSINEKKYPMRARVGLALVQNKLGLLESCASNLKTLNSIYADKATTIYPIKVNLKKSLHDPVLAQKEFKRSIFDYIENRFGLLFYFAPYKLYNPKQSNSIIEKGAKEIYINNIKSAYNYLIQANSISEINLELIKGLQLLQKHKVYEANKLFKTLISKYPNHSILHYNLALSYANISNYKKANEHFNKSYILDQNNHLALFFAAFTDLLQNKDFDEAKLEKVIKYSDKNTVNELMLLYKILKNDTALVLDNKLDNNPFKIVTNIIAANMIGDEKAYTADTKKLKSILPKDLIANIIYIDQISQDKDIKEYAKAVQEYLTRKDIDITPLLYGETFARELYVRILNIGGVTRFAKDILENELLTNKNQIALLQSLAYTYIYTKEFEKSYQLYNRLIDELKVDDPHTLFLASVASIGANHHANAIALLELANLDDKSLFESRYALGLLYHEAKNLEGAAIQYARVGNNGFKSRYFDFNLKH